MKDVLIQPAPGLEEPLEMLEACHERLQAQLRTLSRLVAWLPEHGADAEARQAARAVMRYFDVAAVNHHHDEEDDFFPLLLARADADRRPLVAHMVEALLADHQTLYEAWRQMRVRLSAIADGEGTLSAEEVETFALRYQGHIDREEAELLPLARELLSAADVAALTESMTARRRVPL